MPFPLPCCYTDGRPCWEQWCEIPGQAAAEQACRDSGGCPGTFGIPCEDWVCEEHTPVSCCDLTDGECYAVAWHTCVDQYGGIPLCPDGCIEGELPEITCTEMATALHVCCTDDYPYCHISTYAECIDPDVGGTFLWEQDECNEFVCGVGCREALAEPFVPDYGPEWGQKKYTTDTCYPAPMALVEPLPEHGLGIPPGYLVPATIGEVRNVAQVGINPPAPPIDPCAIAYGVLAFGIDGYLRPYLCSQLDHSDVESAAYSEGVFCASPDNDGVVGYGYLYARVAVMAQPPREVQYHHPQLICGGIE